MKRAVVVAENSLIVEAISIGLRSSGEFNLLESVDRNGESVDRVLAGDPDVVLLDDDLSEDTLGLVRELVATRPEIVIIVLTLAPESGRLDALFDAGAAGAVSKAAQPSALPTLIRETVDGRVLHLHKPAGTPTASPRSAAAEESSLSARELEVLQLVASGATNGEIARKLWVTEQTVKFHLSNIYRKLDVANRTEASRYAHVNGLF
jgi:DNA-binding NarL/FixJ family response regulator